MPGKFKDILKYILSAAAALALLYVSFKDVEWKDFWICLRGCKWGFVLLSMALGVAAFFFRAARWRMMLLPIDPHTRLGSTFNAINISYVANMILPRAGELARCGYAVSNSSTGPDGKKLTSFDKALGTVVADRLWDVMTMAVLFCMILFLLWKKFGSFFMKEIFGSVGSSASFDVVVIFCSAVAASLLAFFLVWIFRRKNKLCARIWKVVAGFGEGLSSTLHMKRAWMFAVYTLGVWTMYWLMSAGIVWALQGMDSSSMSAEVARMFPKLNKLNLVDSLFLMLVGAISSIVPVPGGFGAFHYLVSLSLSAVYGIPTSIGIIFATLSHESQTITQLICGSASYALESLGKSKPRSV